MSSKRPSSIWAYVLIAFSLVILGLSMFALLQAMTALQAGQTTQFIFYGLWALVGTVLAVSSITRMRQRMVFLQHIAAKVLSQIVCAGCGFKVIRAFNTGDYVSKEVGQCQQCKGSMRVDLIYAESPQPKKS
jgi:glucan phosphoethanolaminetransferase (alkaline phosphatase superfamily)